MWDETRAAHLDGPVYPTHFFSLRLHRDGGI
jgi:hypothetical protein